MELPLNKRILKFVSWFGLFGIQIFFSFYIQDTLFRIIILSTYMISTSILWIKNVEKRSIRDRLDLHLKNFQFLIYTLVLSVVILYVKDNFGTASLLFGGSILLPIIEELFFRCYLLGSMMNDWPNFYSLPRKDRRSFIRKATPPLFLTSLAFALVHNDIISLVINGNIGFMLFVLIIIRVIFGWAVGGIYILQKNISMPSILHIIFNISYYIFNP
jgi:membrane protease YdiL (CAAX protease family)